MKLQKNNFISGELFLYNMNFIKMKELVHYNEKESKTQQKNKL